MLLADRVVVVTGVGPGLGRAIAVQAATAGADLVLAARTGARLQEVAEQVRGLGRRALAVPTDITDDGSAAALRDAALAEFGRVDALVNNAFAIPPLGDLCDVDFDRARAGFETNVFGNLRVSRLFVPALTASGGSIVMINSSVRHHSRQPYGAYKMTKAALLAMSQALASELGPRGIRVNSVAPGWIWADTLQAYFRWQAKTRGVDPQAVYDETAASIDLRRLPVPAEIADAVVYLASDLARGITGHCLDVNAGEYHA
ncbi:MAG: SDR family oxidoreductase [Jatrophihabitans sp.]|nr:MAG: SDR family oxidoreductase [Jatrophihabitans sp.]